MGIIQQKCEECLEYSIPEEKEFNKEHYDNLKLDLSSNINSRKIALNKNEENNQFFIENSIEKAVLAIINPKLYEKMLKGEKIHSILEPLTTFSNNNLFRIIKELLFKIEELKRNEKNKVYLNFEKVYKELINKGIIDNMNSLDLGFFTNVKFNLIYIIEIITEIYHYFKFHISDGIPPYNIHLWEFVKNTAIYMNEKIKDFQHTLEETHNFIKNKLKNSNKSVNIHITTNDFLFQIEQ